MLGVASTLIDTLTTKLPCRASLTFFHGGTGLGPELLLFAHVSPSSLPILQFFFIPHNQTSTTTASSETLCYLIGMPSLSPTLSPLLDIFYPTLGPA